MKFLLIKLGASFFGRYLELNLKIILSSSSKIHIQFVEM